MKTLYLVRHAKSSWDDMSLDDFDRPLNSRGKRDAPIMGEILAKLRVQPEILISSPAKRAKATAYKIAEALGKGKDKILLDEDLYHASANEILKVISKVDNKAKSLMLFGHNPGLTFFANRFSNAIIDNIPTAGIVCFEFNTDSWQQIDSAPANLKFFEYPKRHY